MQPSHEAGAQELFVENTGKEKMNEGRKGKIKNVLCCLQNEVSPMRFYYSLGSLF